MPGLVQADDRDQDEEDPKNLFVPRKRARARNFSRSGTILMALGAAEKVEL